MILQTDEHSDYCGIKIQSSLFIELEIKDTTDTDRSASYLDLHLEIDSEGWLRTKHYDKRYDFNFSTVNFPFICSNIPAAHAYRVYYLSACGSY
jgi:hypothetical protein